MLKKYATGKGNCEKNLILLSVYKNFGQEFKSDDIADAYVLAHMCRSFFMRKMGEKIELKSY